MLVENSYFSQKYRAFPYYAFFHSLNPSFTTQRLIIYQSVAVLTITTSTHSFQNRLSKVHWLRINLFKPLHSSRQTLLTCFARQTVPKISPRCVRTGVVNVACRGKRSCLVGRFVVYVISFNSLSHITQYRNPGRSVATLLSPTSTSRTCVLFSHTRTKYSVVK